MFIHLVILFTVKHVVFLHTLPTITLSKGFTGKAPPNPPPTLMCSMLAGIATGSGGFFYQDVHQHQLLVVATLDVQEVLHTGLLRVGSEATAAAVKPVVHLEPQGQNTVSMGHPHGN